MPVDTDLSTLNVELPTPPASMLRITTLMADPDCHLGELGAVIEGDMALAAAVLKAVNSSLFGLSGAVQSVQQAVTYLGVRDVAAVTLQAGLRALFPGAAELDALWQRATARGRVFGRLAHALGVDPWSAHSAGLFEECGKAVLFRHDSARYRDLLERAANDAHLLLLEQDTFGVGHDTLGAALCETWGLSTAAVHSVRYHVELQNSLLIPTLVRDRGICAVSALAHRLAHKAAALESAVDDLCKQMMWDAPFVLAAVHTEQTVRRAMASSAF